MWNGIELALASVLLWLYLESVWLLIFDCFYFTLPWFVWGAVVIFVLMKFAARIPPPNEEQVKKVLGIDPREFETEIDGIEVENKKSKKNEFCLRVIAHRGAGYDYPENSLSAFSNSRKKGCDAIEFDLALTKDNVPILFHDENTYRLTGITGYIKDMTWDQLKDYDISATHCLRSKFGPEGENIALFEKVIEDALESDQRMFIDIKSVGIEVVEAVLNAFKKYPELYDKAVVSSFNPVTIYNIRKRDPRIIGGIAYRPKFFAYTNYDGLHGPYEPRYRGLFKHLLATIMDIIHDWAFEHVTYYILGLSFILLHKDLINPDVVRLWNERGIRIFAWTVNLPSEKAHFTKNLKVSYLTDTLLS